MIAAIALAASIICTPSGSGILICQPATEGEVNSTLAAMRVGTYQHICINSMSPLQRDSYPGGFRQLVIDCGQRAVDASNKILDLQERGSTAAELHEIVRSLQLTTHR